MNPLLIASLIGTAASIGSNIWSTSKQSKENAKMREYNLELAKLQNQWNLEQWNRENAYNDPTNQKNRIISAGLNPDMLYGNGSITNTAASSPSMTSGAAASPMDWSSLANINPVSTYLDNQLKQAQINKINSETEGQNVQNEILTSDSKFRDAWNEGQLATMNSTIHLQGVNARTTERLTEQEIKESQARIMHIDSQVDQLSAVTTQIYNAVKNDNARLEIEKALSDANIRKIASECHLNYTQAKNIADQLEKIIRQYNDNHDIALAQKINLGREGEILLHEGTSAKFEARVNTFSGYDSDLSHWQNAMTFLTQIMSTVGRFLKR